MEERSLVGGGILVMMIPCIATAVLPSTLPFQGTFFAPGVGGWEAVLPSRMISARDHKTVSDGTGWDLTQVF